MKTNFPPPQQSSIFSSLQISCWLVLLLALPGLAQAQHSLTGIVFEDVNYGGGAGHNYSAANSLAVASGFTTGSLVRPRVRVELYASNALVAATQTNAAGLYTFSGLADGVYTVRVMNQTVTSSRPGPVSYTPVQTYRTTTFGGTLSGDANRVGGEQPGSADAGANGTLANTTATGTNMTLTFAGLNSTGDNTMFIDNVQVLSGGTALATNPLTNPDFENGTLTGGFQYNPSSTGIGWTFSPTSGIYSTNSGFAPPNPVSGSRAGLVQSNAGRNGTISQDFSLPAGTYTLSFLAANRTSNGQQAINVIINGIVVLANQTATAGTFATYTTGTFTVGTGTGGAQALTTFVAQSVGTANMSGADVTGVDFGYNFDTVVNTNDAGQGSLRQFVLNANTLTNANLAQSGNRLNAAVTAVALPTANHEESSIFMIPIGTEPQVAGHSSGQVNGLNGSPGGTSTAKWALLPLSSALAIAGDAYTILDGTTQAANGTDTNPGLVGLGGTGNQFPTVGTTPTAFSQFSKPEVEVYATNTFANLVLVQASNTTVRGFALHGAGNNDGTVRADNITGFLLENNLIGVTANSLADPNVTLANTAGRYGVELTGTNIGATIRRNVVAYCSNSGIYIPSGGTSGSSSILITNNELAQNGFRIAGGDNVTIADMGNTGPVQITYNLIRSANSNGVQFDIGNTVKNGTQTNVVQNNTFFNNGNGGESSASSQLEGAGILYLQRGGSATSTNQDVISNNVLLQTQASAIVVDYGQSGLKISQNSIYFNGTPFNTPTGGTLGIDLISQSTYFVSSGDLIGKADYGNGDGITPNTGALTTAAAANGAMNYPIFTMATATGRTSSTVNVAGYVGDPKVTGGTAAFAGATVEIFTADDVLANNRGPEVTGDGRLSSHGEGRTYLGVLTADANGYFSGQIPLPMNTPPLTGYAVTGYLTATAYLPTYGTSEFGPNRPIIAPADVQALIVTGNSTTTNTVTAGQQGTFTVSYNNVPLSGPVQADGVVATVQLPPGLTTYGPVTASNGGSYNNATGLVTYTGYTVASPGTLASNGSFSSTITYTQPSAQPVAATATISTTTSEGGQTTNNFASATNATALYYNLVTAINGPTAATAGNQVAYVVTSTNANGYLSPANNVTQTVSVPAGATNIYVTGGGIITAVTGGGFLVTYTLALSPNESQSQTVSFTAPAGNYAVTANISGSPADAILTDNAATTGSVTVTAASGSQGNVYARVATTTPTVATSSTGSFVVREGNAGPNPALGVQITVVLPPGLSNVVVTDSATNAVVSGAYVSATGVVTLPLLTSQQPGAAARKSYFISLTTPAVGGTVSATAAVLTTSPDQVPFDNTATAQITVPAQADLVVQLVGPTAATAGQFLAYTLTTFNNGPGSVQNVRQTASLPVGIAIAGTDAVLLLNGAAPTSVTGSIATYGTGATAITYDQTTGKVTFPVTAIIVQGQSVVTTFTFPAPANGGLSLAISSSANGPSTDANPANNAATLLTTLKSAFDVQVLLSGTGQSEAGNPITFAVTTLNNGPSSVAGVNTTVNLPASLPITGGSALRINGNAPTSTTGGVASYGSGAAAITYNQSNGLVTYPTINNLIPGTAAAVTSTLTFVLPTGYQGNLVTTATALPTTANGLLDDYLPNNNVVTTQPVLTDVDATLNDLQLTLLPGAASVVAGAAASFTLQTKNGSGVPATGVLQYVQLPPGLAAGSNTVTVTSGGNKIPANYDNVTGLLTLPPVQSLAVGSALTYSIAISQVPGATALTATASASSGQNESAPADNLAIASITITPTTALAAAVSGPATAPAGTTVTYLVSATNTGSSPATGTAQTVTLPIGATNVLLNGVAATPGAGNVLTLPIPTTVLPGAANTVTNTLSFTAPGSAGSTFAVPTSFTATGPGTVAPATASQSTLLASSAPIALDVVNTKQAPEGNTADALLAILPLKGVVGTGSSATIANYTLVSLPPAAQGVLYVGTTALTAANFPGLVLTTTQAANLYFQPAANYVGNATFTYFTTDSYGAPSNIARYLVPVAGDQNSFYQSTTSKTVNAYANNDVLAYVIDTNGALYTSTGQLYSAGTGQLVDAATTRNGLPTTGTNAVLAATNAGPSQNPSNALPAGTALNATTGQIYVTDRAQLPRPGGGATYYVNVITHDLYGGTNVALAQFTILPAPLPVQLTQFEASARQADALLTWATASETNSDHFDVERSLDGVHFYKIAQVAGQGSKLTATSYALTDASIGHQASGPVYYRLRQVDTGGTATYSLVRTVTFGQSVAASLSVYPNPATRATTLDLNLLPTGIYQVTLTDVLGQVVQRFSQVGGNTQLLDVQALTPGIYHLRLAGTAATGEAVAQTVRFTKQ